VCTSYLSAERERRIQIGNTPINYGGRESGDSKDEFRKNKEKMETILHKLPKGLNCSIQRGQLTGTWLTVLPSIVNGMELSAEEFRDCGEFRDVITIRYGELPSNFPHKCMGVTPLSPPSARS
jgi:hypothetical protein